MKHRKTLLALVALFAASLEVFASVPVILSPTPAQQELLDLRRKVHSLQIAAGMAADIVDNERFDLFTLGKTEGYEAVIANIDLALNRLEEAKAPKSQAPTAPGTSIVYPYPLTPVRATVNLE